VLSRHATTVPSRPEFMFLQGDGCRDLDFGDEPVYRYVYGYDPLDRENTYKPYHHIFGFHGEGYITKGPGGAESHHRGIFFGFNTPYGNFWADKVAHQEHVAFADGGFAGPLAARAISEIDWRGKDGDRVIRETRGVTAWRPKLGVIILDFDVVAESLKGDIKPTGNVHHSGFHFRAAEEVGGAKPSLHSGGCTYLRNAEAKPLKDDEWDDTSWVAGMFSIKGNPYVVVEMRHPSNPKSTFSTRPYGRFGACFTETLHEKQPMNLRYRFVIMDGNDKPDAPALAAMYANYISPAKDQIAEK